MAIYQIQKRPDCFFIEVINSFRAVCFHPYKTASFKPAQMMRNKTLLITKFLGNISDPMRPIMKEMDNIPPHLIAEGFEKELVWLVQINALHSMNYNSYLITTQAVFYPQQTFRRPPTSGQKDESLILVGTTGFEPVTFSVSRKRSATELSAHSILIHDPFTK